MTYQFLPPLSDAEYEALREDIAQNGMRHPILVDEKGKILDGHHRARIAAELGFKPEREVLGGLSEVEKRDVAFKMNIARRHMDTAGKRAAVTASLKADPQLSDRQHGRRTGVSHPTVAGIRAELEAAGRLESFTSRVSADGRERPATQPSQPEPQPVEVDAPLDTHGMDEPVVREAEAVPAVDAGDGAGTRIPAPPAAVETPGASVSADASGDSVGADAAGAPTDLDTAGAPVIPEALRQAIDDAVTRNAERAEHNAWVKDINEQIPEETKAYSADLGRRVSAVNSILFGVELLMDRVNEVDPETAVREAPEPLRARLAVVDDALAYLTRVSDALKIEVPA